MDAISHTLLLADDDSDDCIFFKDALDELPVSANLITVKDGVELMELLSESQTVLPDILFLDLNMPRKTGFECLFEIKANEKLKHLPIVILSTSLDLKVVNSLYDMGAPLLYPQTGRVCSA
jgi:CheY-like chemotaxis protein